LGFHLDFFLEWNFLKSICILIRGWGRGAILNIEGTISKEVVVFMEAPATERDVFIIEGLNPFIVLIEETDGVQQCLGEIHIDAYASIGGVAPIFFISEVLTKLPSVFVDAFKYLLIPKFLGEGVHSNPD
jgi:hypothetical protein